MKTIVGQLNKGKNLEENLPAYANRAAATYHRYAKVRLMMEYYMSYEVEAEQLNAHVEMVKSGFNLVHEIIGGMYGTEAQEEQKSRWRDKLLAEREATMEKMKILTSYVDAFILYEYVFNRLQYRFDAMTEEISDTELAQKLVQFIFSSKDNVVINDNIHLVLGQLPVRMAKSKYYDMVKNSLSMYKGADKESLDSYLYMFRTSAMLYRPEGMEEHFTEFGQVIKELETLDFGKITEEQYRLYGEKIALQAEKLKEISDLYMSLQQVVNNLLAILYAEEITQERLEKEEGADRIIQGIHSLFTETDSDIWQEAGEHLQTEEEKLEWLSEQFAHVEGLQEADQESLYLVEAVLPEIKESRREQLEEMGLAKDYEILGRLEQLMSSSIFIEFKEAVAPETVGDNDLEQVTKELIGELEQLFAEKGRYVQRAVMAGTLEKMPVFFQSAQEVADYVSNALEQCSDKAEKYTVAMLMEELV